MGDRCHLQVRTLNALAHLFEELGMLVESEDEPHEVELETSRLGEVTPHGPVSLSLS